MNAVIIVTSSVLFTALGSTGIAGASPAQLLVCRRPIADKGTCKAGSPITHTFELHNISADPVRITAIEGGCACARLACTSQEIPPGQTTQVRVEINTWTQPAGTHRWPIRLRYRRSDPHPLATEQHYELIVCAHIVQEIQIAPTRLIISTCRAATEQFTLTDTRPRPLNIHKATSLSPYVQVQTQRLTPSQYQVRVHLADGCPAGEHDATVSLWTDDPEYREIRLPVLVVRRAPQQVTVFPEELIFEPVADRPSSQMIQLRSRQHQPVRIAEVDSDHPALRWKYPEQASRSSAVRISLEPAVAGPSGQALLRIRLAEPVVETILVPVRWQAPSTPR
jgi:hypothetical protein